MKIKKPTFLIQVLPDCDVSMLLESVERKRSSLVDEKSRKKSDERYEMAMVWMRYVMSEVGAIPIDDATWSQCIGEKLHILSTKWTKIRSKMVNFS